MCSFGILQVWVLCKQTARPAEPAWLAQKAGVAQSYSGSWICACQIRRSLKSANTIHSRICRDAVKLAIRRVWNASGWRGDRAKWRATGAPTRGDESQAPTTNHPSVCAYQRRTSRGRRETIEAVSSTCLKEAKMV